MKKAISITLALFVCWNYYAQNFQKILGGPGNERGSAVVITYDGGYATAGHTTSYGAGGEDFYVIKTDSLGNILWQKTYGATGDEGMPVRVDLAQTPDSGFLLGGATSSFGAVSLDGYILRLDSLGNVLWEYKYSTANAIESIHEFSFLANGDILAYGSDNQDNFGSADALLLRLDSNGNLIWSRVYGGGVNDSFSTAMELPGGNIIAAGSSSTFGPGSYGGYLVKMDANGNIIWDYSYGGSGQDGFSASLMTDDNYIITTGPTSSFGSGDVDILLTKIDTNGIVLWSKAYGGSNFDRGVSVTEIPNSTDLYLASLTQSYNNGDYDILIMRVDSIGNMIWSKKFGTDGSDQVHIWGAKSTLQSTDDGGFIFTGWSDSLSIGADDALLIKGDSLGSILCTDVVVNTTSFTLPMIDPTSSQATTGTYIPVTSTITTPSFTDSSICYCVDPEICVVCTTPFAAFTADTTSGLSVQFMDFSSGAQTWLWNFGDGYLSTLQDPTHVFSAPGTYNVCLIITNSCGTDTVCGPVTICEPPVANFSANETLNTIQFSDLSTNATNWQWDFGDGNQSSDQNPLYTYAAPGTYTVCLIATNSCSSDTICQQVCACEPPNADFEADTLNGTTIQFTDVSLGATSWSWDFGDGNTSTSQNPVNSYMTPGYYTVCLTVTNSCSSDTTCQQIYVCELPVADFVQDSTSGLTVFFNNLSSNSTSWEWDFGDGNYSTNQNPTHYYSTGGWYDVCLVAINDCSSDTVCVHMYVEDNVGLADLKASGITIYPNPTSGVFTINGIIEGRTRVVDIFGRLVLISEGHEIDMSAHPKGIYFVNVNDAVFKLVLR